MASREKPSEIALPLEITNNRQDNHDPTPVGDQEHSTTPESQDSPTAWKLFSNAAFTIGEDDCFAPLRGQFTSEPNDEKNGRRFTIKWGEALRDARVRVGILLKSENTSFLLGAGASTEAGGVLIGSIPIEIEKALLNSGLSGGRVRGWLKLFYRALRHIRPVDPHIPPDRAEIVQRLHNLAPATRIGVNLETLLTYLYRWRAALPESGGRLRIDTDNAITAEARDLDECILQTKRALAAACALPTTNADPNALDAYKGFLKKLLTRPLNLKRVNIFTLNYDTLVEQAADATGVVALDGFVGTIRRCFRPESFDHDLYFPAETTEGRVHRLDRVIHLYKLHGSLTWRSQDPSADNPYGITIHAQETDNIDTTLIYPTPAKFGETLGMPYAELFRRFAAAVVRPQSTLIVAGYGFGDDHVNAIIRQALAVPSFTLVVVDPLPTSDFINRLSAQRDQRVWLFKGTTLGCFPAFVSRVLPDLCDEDILRKVVATHRALAVNESDEPAEGDRDAE
jgi:hypothetical protein